MPDRPTGVTMIAVLFLFGSVILFLGALSFTSSPFGNIASVFFLCSVFGIAISFGMFRGWKWAWYVSVILWIVGIIAELVVAFSNPFALSTIWAAIIPAICLWYFFQNQVKTYFGIGVASMSLASQPLNPAPYVPVRTMRCPICGWQNTVEFSFCGKCGKPLKDEETKIY